MSLDNIAEKLDSNYLAEIASDVIKDTTDDKSSRIEWEKDQKEALKIAKQVIEPKNSPWPGASGVKYPLILEACVQFNARTNPEIIQSDKVVKVNVSIPGPPTDQSGNEAQTAAIAEQAEDRAERLSNHMSFQLLEESDNWRSDTDKLLMALPLVGVVYRKSYFDSIDKRPQIDFCLPSEIIIHNNVASLESAPRITHILRLSSNDLIARMRAGLYTHYDLEELGDDTDASESTQENSPEKEQTTRINGMHDVYEQHTFLDLDDDGYEEPYIVTVHRIAQKVLRIVARYDEESFVFDGKSSKFIKINAIQHFTDYHFIPSPDGTFHSLGFGTTLYPINETINSLINQLIDSGTLANRGGGFIGKELRVRKEDLKFKLGEFKQINVPTGSTLAQNVYSLPVKEPSPALFNLLDLMIKAGQDIASISDVLKGNPPAPNTPMGTVMAMVEQSGKVYSSMLYRLYSSFKKEFRKLYEINRKYFDLYPTESLAIRLGQVTLEDYKAPDYGITPVADPSMSSDMHRVAQAQGLMNLMQIPGVNQYEILHRYLTALKIQNIDKILPPPPPPDAPPPPPSPQEQLLEAEVKLAELQPSLEMMDRELRSIDLQIKQDQMQSQAAYWGGQVAADKVNSITRIAETDAAFGTQVMQDAERQEAQMEKPLSGDPELHMRLQNIEQTIAQLVGGPQGGPGPGLLPSVQQPTSGAPEGMPPVPEDGSQMPAGGPEEQPSQ